MTDDLPQPLIDLFASINKQLAGPDASQPSKKHAIRITVAGTLGKGKTTIAVLIKNALLAHCIDCEIVNPDNVSFIEEHLEDAVSALNTTVGIRMVDCVR